MKKLFIVCALCLAVPAIALATGGDDCAGATDVATIMTACDGTPYEDSAIGMDTATASAGPAGSCFVPGSVVENDRWYAWTNSSGVEKSLTVSTDGAPNPTGGDSEIAIYDDCAGTTELACDQDGGDFGSGWLSVASTNVANGDTVYIQLDGYNGDDTFTSVWFTCDDPPTPPANDDCATATEVLSVPLVDAPNIVAAGNDVDISCNSGSATETRYGVWYVYTPSASGDITVTVAGADTAAAVFTGGCGALSEVACSDPQTLTYGATGGTEYHILVGMWSAFSDPSGPIDVTIDGPDPIPVELQSFSIQ